MRSKFLRMTYKALGTWWLLLFVSYVLMLWTWYQSYNINQLLGNLKPLRSRSLNSMAWKKGNFSLGLLWIPGTLHSYTTCNPGYHTSNFPLCFTWLQFIPFAYFGKINQSFSCKTFMSLAYFWRRLRRIYIFMVTTSLKSKHPPALCPIETQWLPFVDSSFFLIFVLFPHSSLAIPPRSKSLASANP